MYLSYYGFEEYPFSVTPDPAFLYLSASHREALGHLLYGMGEHGGFVALLGEVGTGKTTLIRALIANDTPDVDIALCWNPHLGVEEFVATVCDELGADYDAQTDRSLKRLVDRLNHHLLATHANNRRTVLIIDEAQNLSRGVLEQLRLLTNLETHKHKLLRIILVGQPELDTLLHRHDLRQLAQRITARFWIRPLSVRETRAYVQHRLELAGGWPHIFTPVALYWLRLCSGGIPRLINMVCERALMGGYAYGRARVGTAMVMRAAGETLPRRRRRWTRLAAPALALLVAAIIGVLAWYPGIELSRAAEWIQRDAPGQTVDNSGGKAAATGTETAKHARAEQKNVAVSAAAGEDSEKRAQTHASDKQSATAGRQAQTEPGDTAGTDSATDLGKPNESVEKAVETRAGNTRVANTAEPIDSARQAVDPGQNTDSKQTAETPNGAEKTSAGRAEAPGGGIPAGDADINQLLRLWGVFGSQVRSGCSSLRVGDLRCLAERGNFAMIERFNRPALLTVHEDAKRHTVLLSSLDDNSATLVGADGTRRIARDRLARLWTGQFEVVWRADSGLGLIQPGAVGGAVVWLRRRLARANGANPDAELGPPSPVYDDALQAQLKRFQLAHGLEPDGLAGPRTQMMLNGAVKMPGSPALRPVGK